MIIAWTLGVWRQMTCTASTCPSAKRARATAVPAPPSPGFGIGKINHPVLGKTRRQRDIEQAALTAGEYFGHSRQWLRDATVRAHDAQAAGALGH